MTVDGLKEAKDDPDVLERRRNKSVKRSEVWGEALFTYHGKDVHLSASEPAVDKRGEDGSSSEGNDLKRVGVFLRRAGVSA